MPRGRHRSRRRSSLSPETSIQSGPTLNADLRTRPWRHPRRCHAAHDRTPRRGVRRRTSSGIAIADGAPCRANRFDFEPVANATSRGIRAPPSAICLSRAVDAILTLIMTNPIRQGIGGPALSGCQDSYRTRRHAPSSTARVRDDDQRLRAAEHAGERAFQRLGIQRGEALVEHAHVERLEQRARDEQAAALAVRQLPAAVADQLLQPRRHARQQRAEIQLAQHRLGLGDVLAPRRPGAPEQQVEQEGLREDVVLVELRRRAHAPAPARQAERLLVDARRAPAARVGNAQADEQRAQRRLAAARRALEQHAIAAPDVERAARQHRLAAARIAEADVARAEQRRVGRRAAVARGRRRRAPAAAAASVRAANIAATWRQAMTAPPSAGNACASLRRAP